MIEAITYALIGAATASTAAWLIVRPKLALLRRLTDRDAKGRFVRREP